MRDTVATRAAVRSGTALGINPTTLDDLPPAVLREILRRLPADHRARCACVCRRWRDVLSDPALWTVLDLRAASGVTVRVTPARLLAAAARAQGRLEVLNVLDDGRLLPALTAVATANASTLRELRSLSFEGDVFPDGDEAERALAELRALLLAAPALQVLEAMMECRIATACRVLRNEPPFGPLRLTRLNVDCSSVNRDVTALAAALVTHPSLDTLSLTCPMDHPMPLLPGDLDSVVTAALTLRLQSFDLCDCELMGDAVPALSRLLSSTDSLTDFGVKQRIQWVPLLHQHVALLLAEALRANRTLTSLALTNVMANSKDEAMLLLALVGHATLRYLDFSNNVTNVPQDESERDDLLVGMSLGALVAANSPALKTLDVAIGLEDDGLGPLCDALPRNTHLRTLNTYGNRASTAFAAQRLLPAVRANNSLQQFIGDDVAAEAMDLVNWTRMNERAIRAAG